MPRRKLFRKIINPPHFRGFMPVDLQENTQPVVLGFEEYEAIRLCDFDGYHHSEASGIMNVSRPTFARIYEEARRKVATAFVQGCPILFEGGKFYCESEWFQCRSCNCKFNHFERQNPPVRCALCGAENVFPVADDKPKKEHVHECVCFRCGRVKEVPFGMPCSHVVCENCGSRLRRKRN